MSYSDTLQNLRDENNQLKETLNKVATTGAIILPVRGSFKAIWRNPMGGYYSRIVSFKDGATQTRITDGSGDIVSSEFLITMANDEYLSDQQLDKHPVIKKMGVEGAKALLTYLAQVNYGLLKEAELVKEEM